MKMREVEEKTTELEQQTHPASLEIREISGSAITLLSLNLAPPTHIIRVAVPSHHRRGRCEKFGVPALHCFQASIVDEDVDARALMRGWRLRGGGERYSCVVFRVLSEGS